MDYKAMYEQWLDNPYFDEETKAELKAIAGDEKENSVRQDCAGSSVQVQTV